MRRVLNWLLIISLFMMLLLGGLLYYSYRKSQVTDTTLLELNASLYQNPIQIKEGKVEDTATNIIFYTSEDGSELKEVVIEVLQCKQGRLAYLTIPANTEIIVGARLYQKLAAIYPEMPQYFQLDKLAGLFDSEKRYAYGQLILDDMLSMDSSYYTVIPGSYSTFQDYRDAMKRQYSLQTTEQIKEFVKTEYSKFTSNLSKKKKQEYTEYYADVSGDSIIQETVKGELHTDSYEIDLAEFAIQKASTTIAE